MLHPSGRRVRRRLGPSRLRPAVCGLAIVGAAMTLVGCVTVKPSERRHLSKPEMTPATDVEEESFHTHVEASREGSFGGHGAAGGGCGCG